MSDYSTHWPLDIRSVSCEMYERYDIRCFFADGLFGMRGVSFDWNGIIDTWHIPLHDVDGFYDGSEFVGLFLNTTVDIETYDYI